MSSDRAAAIVELLAALGRINVIFCDGIDKCIRNRVGEFKIAIKAREKACRLADSATTENFDRPLQRYAEFMRECRDGWTANETTQYYPVVAAGQEVGLDADKLVALLHLVIAYPGAVEKRARAIAAPKGRRG
jgi:hypothetical protein